MSMQGILNRFSLLCFLGAFGLLSLSLNVLAADKDAEQLESIVPVTVSMRNHGYVLGDFVEMETRFTLPKKLKLDRLSLPLKGPMNAWEYQVNYTWQLFATVRKAQKIKLPQVMLQTLPVATANDEVTKPEFIFAQQQEIYLSPVLPNLVKEKLRQPLIKPPKFDSKWPFLWAILSALSALLLVLFWLRLNDKLAFWPKHPGPITVLNRQLKRQLKADRFSTETLRLIHQALAACAGESLYPNSLDSLFNNAPYLGEFEADIRPFFEQSWRLFHIEDIGPETISVTDTMAWLKQAGMRECLYRRQQVKARYV